MIKLRTVYITGAGSSFPYGLPLGSGLLKQAKAVQPDSAIHRLVRLTCGNDVGRLNEILSDLRQFRGPSIDDFMEKRPSEPDTRQACRALIAGCMGRSIFAEQSLYPKLSQQDWLATIVHQMAAGTSSFEELAAGNAVAFVTFNFDSVIENHLAALMRSLYGSKADLCALPSALPVYHVHGRLPPLPSGPPALDPSVDPALDPSGDVNANWIQWIEPAAQSVRVVVDSPDDSILTEARSAVARAQVVCFLGFSYHPTNVERLALQNWDKGARRAVFGSTHKMTFAAVKDAQRLLQGCSREPLVLDPQGFDCRKMLESYDLFA